ncbi:uncharacterized protein LOC144866688 isoform X2 [Branchiostoma floridae x Branchiostoma japonicum]
MGKKKQTKVTKKGGLIYSKAEWKEEYPAFRSGGGDENLVPRRPKKGDRERRARPYSEPVLSEINVDEPYDEEKARTLDRPSRPKSVMVGGPEARTKSPSRQPSRNLLSCLQIPEEQDEDEAVVTGDVPRIVVEEVDQPPTKRARQEPTKRSPQDPRRGRYGDVPMETNLPIEAIHLAGPAKPGRDARGSPAKPTGTGTEASLDRRGPGTKSKPGNEGRDGTPDTDEKGKGKKKKVFGGKKKEKEDSEKDAQEGKKKQPKEKKKEKERKNKKAAEKGNEREDRRQSPEGDDGTLQLWEASLDRDPHGRGRPKDKRSSRQSPENMAGDDLAPTRVDDLAFTPVPVEHVTLAPAANMAAAPPQSEARVQAAPAYASRPEIVRPSEAPSDAPRMIKITFPVEQGVQTSPKSTPTSPTYLSPTSARPVSPESSPEHRRDGERGRARQRRTPEGGALEGEFLRRRSPLGDRYIVEKARLLDANVTPTDYAKMEAELESRSAPPGLEYPEHRSGAVPEYLVIGGLEHRSIPTQTTSSVFSRPSYSYTDSTATIAMATHADTMATHADTMATHPDSHALRKVVAKEVSVSSLQDMSSSPGGEAVSGEMVTTETQEYKLYSSSSSFKTIEMYGAKFTLVGPTPTVVTETTTTSHITGTEPEYVTATSYVSGTAAKPGSNQMQYTTSTSHMPGTTPETHYVTSYVSGAQTQPDASHTQYTTSTGYVAGAHPDASPMQHTSSVTTYSAGPTQYAVPTQPASTSPSQYAVQAPQASTGPTQYTVPAAQVSASPTQYTVPAQPAVVVRREAATIQTVQQTKAANREAAVVESSHDIEIRPLRMEEETREEASPRSPEVIVSNLSPVRETVATFEQPTPDDQATSQYKLNYMHFPGRDTTITVVKRLSAGPTTLEGQQPEGEGGADLQADLSQRKPEVTYETKMVVTEVKSEVRQQKVPEASYTPEEVKVNTGDLQESAPIFETKYEERAVDVPLPEVAPAEEEVAAEVPEKKEKKKKKKRSWFRKGSSSSTSDDHSDAAEKPVTTVMAGDGVDAAVAMATVDDRVDADVAMATVSKLVEGTVVTTTTTRVVSGVEAGPERGMLGMEASVEPREIPEATLHAGKAEPGQGGAGDDLEGVGKVVMAEVKHEPMVLKDKPTGEGEEMRTVGREITDVSEALQVLKGSEADMTPVSQAVSQPITAPSYGSPVSQSPSQPIRAPAYRSPVNQDPSQPIRVASYSSPVSQPISASSSRSPVSQAASQPIRAPVNQDPSQPIRAPAYRPPVNQDPSQPIRAPSQSPESENRAREAGARPDQSDRPSGAGARPDQSDRPHEAGARLDQSDRPGELTILLEGQKAAVPLSRQDRPYERLKNIIEAIDKVLESEGEAKASSALPLHEGIPRSAPHEGTSRSISVQTVQHSSLSNKEVQTDEEVDSEDDFLEVWAGRSPHSPSDRVIISRVPARQSTERRRAAGPTPDNRRPTLDDITVYRDGGCQTEFEADPQLGSPQGVGMEPLGEGSPYEKWRWEEINVVIKHQQDGGKTDVEGVETTWKRVPDVGDGEGEETTGVFDDSYRANNWIYVGDDEELPSAQSTPKGSPVMHSMGTSTDDDDDLPVEFSRRQVGRESTGTTLSEASFRQRYRNASRRKRQDTSARLANLPPAVRERTIRLAKQPGVQFGFRIQKSRPIVITEVDKDSPAERAGIRVGDILTSVQNRDVTDCKHSDAVSIIKQGPTDRLTLTVATTLGNTLRDMGGEPVATGYLHKLSGGRVGKQWRKRWFVLKKDNTLYYYKTREDKEPLGTIVLANYTITPAHEIGRTHAFKASRFNTRTYYFSAATEEEMEMWSRLLNQASAQSAKFGGLGSGEGQLKDPRGICTDRAGNIIVADRGNRRVEMFDKTGKFLKHITTDMGEPWAVAMAPQGQLVVTDNNNKVFILVFDYNSTCCIN